MPSFISGICSICSGGPIFIVCTPDKFRIGCGIGFLLLIVTAVCFLCTLWLTSLLQKEVFNFFCQALSVCV